MSEEVRCKFCDCSPILLEDNGDYGIPPFFFVACCAGIKCCPVHPETGLFETEAEAWEAWELLNDKASDKERGDG